MIDLNEPVAHPLPHRPADGIDIPNDREHEFLSEWADPSERHITDSWERWFKQTGVRYRRVDTDNGRSMLYTHRAFKFIVGKGELWCCKVRRRKASK